MSKLTVAILQKRLKEANATHFKTHYFQSEQNVWQVGYSFVQLKPSIETMFDSDFSDDVWKYDTSAKAQAQAKKIADKLNGLYDGYIPEFDYDEY